MDPTQEDYIRDAVALRAEVGKRAAKAYADAHKLQLLSREDDMPIGIMATEIWKRLLPDFHGPTTYQPSYTTSSPPSSTEQGRAAAPAASTPIPSPAPSARESTHSPGCTCTTCRRRY